MACILQARTSHAMGWVQGLKWIPGHRACWKNYRGVRTLVYIWDSEECFKSLFDMFIAFYLNSGRNPRVPRCQKREKLQNICGARPFFPHFSVNNGGGKLIFGIDVENGCVLETKWEKVQTELSDACREYRRGKLECPAFASTTKWCVNSQNLLRVRPSVK